MNPTMKKSLTSRWFVNFMGSHLSMEEEAAEALSSTRFRCEVQRRERQIFRRLQGSSVFGRITG